MGLIGERFPARSKTLADRLRKGADIQQELLVPVRMMVYSLMGEKNYEQYTRYEREALAGNETAASDWVRMISICRLMIRKPEAPFEFCLN